MKSSERVVEQIKLASNTLKINKFMSERSIIEAINILRQLMKRHREIRELHMLFIDLGKAYDKVSMEVIGRP